MEKGAGGVAGLLIVGGLGYLAYRSCLLAPVGLPGPGCPGEGGKNGECHPLGGPCAQSKNCCEGLVCYDSQCIPNLTGKKLTRNIDQCVVTNPETSNWSKIPVDPGWAGFVSAQFQYDPACCGSSSWKAIRIQMMAEDVAGGQHLVFDQVFGCNCIAPCEQFSNPGYFEFFVGMPIKALYVNPALRMGPLPCFLPGGEVWDVACPLKGKLALTFQ